MDADKDHGTFLILAFVAELMATTRIKNTAEKLGYHLKSFQSASDIVGGTVTEPESRQAEAVVGAEAVLFDKITRWGPALIIFDLANDDIPWHQWIAMLKSSPATRRIPVVCYGPHVDAESLSKARKLAVEVVTTRSVFFSSLYNIIADNARQEDTGQIELGCQEGLPILAKEGVTAFNNGKYFEAHELLEDAWNDEQTPVRALYRALIQLAVAYLQIERLNYPGAIKMLLRLRQWFRPLPDDCQGIDVNALREDAESVYQNLAHLGPDRIDDFDRSLMRPIRFIN